MKLEKTLDNLRETKSGFYNINDGYLTNDLIKIGVKFFMTMFYSDDKELTIIDKEVKNIFKLFPLSPNETRYEIRKNFT